MARSPDREDSGDTEPVSICYRVTEAEFLSACEAHWRAHRVGTRSNLIAGLIGLFLGLATLALAFWIAIALAIVGALLILIVFLRSVVWRQGFRDAKKYRDEIRVTFHSDRLYVETADGTSDLAWSFYSSYLDTPEFVLLYITRRSFSVIPKAAFRDKEELERFLEWVRTRLRKIR